MTLAHSFTRSPRVRAILGYLAGAVLLACLYRAFRGETRPLAGVRIEPAALLESFAAAMAANLVSAWGWQQALAAAGVRTQFRAASRTWYSSMVARYLPGAVPGIIYRVYLARQLGATRTGAALATALDWAGWLITAAAVALSGASWLATGWMGHLPRWSQGAGAAAALLGLMLMAWPRAVTPLLRVAARKLGETEIPRLPVWATARLAPIGLIRWPCYGLALAVFLPASSFPAAMSAFALGWIAGFVTPFAPGGVGVREAVIVAALHQPGLDAAALQAALLSRLTITLSEVVCWGWSLVDARLDQGPKADERTD